MALVLDACALLHIRDPMEFFAMRPDLQSLWIEHVRNTWTGAYNSTGPAGGSQSPAEAMRIQAECLARVTA